MSAKVKDDHNRWRNITVGFRVSPEEAQLLNRYVAMSGLSKQEYILNRLTEKEVKVYGNPRVFKALKSNMADILQELQRIDAGRGVDQELLDLIRYMSTILDDMRYENNTGK